ncbi:hypothetical protein Efla_007546 [Eimeria flavescens]
MHSLNRTSYAGHLLARRSATTPKTATRQILLWAVARLAPRVDVSKGMTAVSVIAGFAEMLTIPASSFSRVGRRADVNIQKDLFALRALFR